MTSDISHLFVTSADSQFLFSSEIYSLNEDNIYVCRQFPSEIEENKTYVCKTVDRRLLLCRAGKVELDVVTRYNPETGAITRTPEYHVPMEDLDTYRSRLIDTFFNETEKITKKAEEKILEAGAAMTSIIDNQAQRIKLLEADLADANDRLYWKKHES
jgi:hypothetical protein